MSAKMTRRMLKVLSGLIIGLVVMAGALPAIAQVDGIERITIHKPGEGHVAVNDQPISVQVDSTTERMIDRVTVIVKGDDNVNCGGANLKVYDRAWDNSVQSPSPAGKSVSVDHTWDTHEVTPANGVYDVQVVVRGNKAAGFGVNDESACRSGVRVNNRPGNPSGVRAALEDGKPVVRWSPNSEVDITKYRVARSIGSGPFQPRDEVEGTSFRDDHPVPGTLPYDTPIRYQVTAFRRSPVTGEIGSDPVTTSSVSIPAPPPPPSPSPSTSPGGVQASPSSSPGSPADLAGRLGSAPKNSDVVAPVSLQAPPPSLGPRRDGGSGFGRLLDFGAEAPGKIIDELIPGSVQDALRSPGKLITQQLRVNPMRFIAMAALLLVIAGHLGRASWNLYRSAGSGNPASPKPQLTV